MKICFITHYPPEKGGVAEYSKKLLNKLIKIKGLDIYVICGISGNRPQFEIINNYKILRIWNIRSYFYPFKLFKMVYKINPNIIHLQFGPYGLKYGGLIGEPFLFLLLLLKFLRKPILMTLHSILTRNQVQIRAGYRINNYIFKKFVMCAFIGFTKIMTLLTNYIMLLTTKYNSTIKKIYLREYKLSEKKHLEIPHACDDIRFVETLKENAKNKLNINNKFMLLCFGHIYPAKGIKYAVKAMKYLKNKEDIILYIVGLAHTKEAKIYLKELRSLIQKYTEKYGVNIKLINKYVSNSETELFFTATDIVLLPYIDNIGASGPLHQVVSYGRPVIAFNCGFFMRDALDGNIILIKYKNSKDMANSINYFYENRKNLKEITNKLINYAKKETWDVCAKRTYDFYMKIMKK